MPKIVKHYNLLDILHIKSGKLGTVAFTLKYFSNHKTNYQHHYATLFDLQEYLCYYSILQHGALSAQSSAPKRNA